jgi:uncharacterized protein (TIGR03435 family)
MFKPKKAAQLTIALLFANQGFAQPTPSFEVASVRPHNPQDSNQPTRTGGPGTHDPEHYYAQGMPLRILLCTAFATADCQQQISGPGWIDSEKYDLAANVPPGTTKEQFQKMLQNLLTERFQLVLRQETKILSVYELVIAKNGPKLRESVEAPPNPDPPQPGPPPKVEHDDDGYPILPPGVPAFIRSYKGWLGHWAAQQQTMSELAKGLGVGRLAAARHVIDKTGLTGKYDFKLTYTLPTAPPNADPAAAPILEDALEQQLGLKLISSKDPFDFIIVDRGEKVPTQN